ncbi:hypothetical protein K449DRAFT_254613 [Hypoxylon sp. EC38]|nr:hypothetical protein K449DRAFT_254613 [Hypoxylon sp. EC38]
MSKSFHQPAPLHKQIILVSPILPLMSVFTHYINALFYDPPFQLVSNIRRIRRIPWLAVGSSLTPFLKPRLRPVTYHLDTFFKSLSRYSILLYILSGLVETGFVSRGLSYYAAKSLLTSSRFLLYGHTSLESPIA